LPAGRLPLSRGGISQPVSADDAVSA